MPSAKSSSSTGVGSLALAGVVCFGLYHVVNYLSNKGVPGAEANTGMSEAVRAAPVSSGGVVPAEPLGQNATFASADGAQTSTPGLPANAVGRQSASNPAELLPRDTSSEWAQLNPSGKGELANVNFLKAGYHVGIDTIGQSFRNPNLQLRSEPPNPLYNTGPWNNTTMTPNHQQVTLELGQGPA